MDPDRLSWLSGILARSDDGRPPLERLLGAAVELLAVTSAGVVVVGAQQHRGSIAASSTAFSAVDNLQFSLGEGPSVDAGDSAGPVLVPDLSEATGRWPAFAAAALADGVLAAFAFPLRVGAIRLGVLSLYRDAPGDLDPEQFRDAVTIARIATHLLLDLESATAPGSVPDHLAEVLEDRAKVHQATGMIAAQLDVDVGTALVRLRSYAWSLDATIESVAHRVVERTLRFDEL